MHSHGDMRHLLFVSLVTATSVAACTPEIQPQPTTPSSLAGQESHDKIATAHDHQVDRAVRAAPVGDACGDTVLNDQLTTGGLQVTNYIPCWDTQDEQQFDHVAGPGEGPVPLSQPAHPVAIPPPGAATPPAPSASSERQAIRALPETEIAACAHIPARERTHSPFAHRRSIAAVTPYYESGQLRGVRVDFKPVVSLTASWMRQAISCHQAHVAVTGDIPDALSQDPTLVQNAEVTVTDADGHLAVLVRTDSADQAAVALAKARGHGPTASVAEGTDPHDGH